MVNADTLSQAIDQLKALGYTFDFNLMYDCIHCGERMLRYRASEFQIDHVLRFEGMSNPDDSSILYAITANDGTKGILVDAYGVYAEGLHSEMEAKLARWGKK